jgi:hypothetical protein
VLRWPCSPHCDHSVWRCIQCSSKLPSFCHWWVVKLQNAYITFPQARYLGRLRLKCDGARAETRFRLSTKQTSPFKSVGASVQSTTGSRGVRINGSNAGYTMFRGSVKSTGYPLHSPVSPSLSLPCVTVCHHISTELYRNYWVANGDLRIAEPDMTQDEGCSTGWNKCTSGLENTAFLN